MTIYRYELTVRNEYGNERKVEAVGEHYLDALKGAMRGIGEGWEFVRMELVRAD